MPSPLLRARNSLRLRVLVATLVLVAAALGVAAFGFERAARGVVQSSLRSHLGARAGEIQDAIARFQRERALTVRNWARADSMQLTIDSGDPKFAEDYLRRTVQDQQGAVSWAALLGIDASVLAAVRFSPGEERAAPLEALRGHAVGAAALEAALAGSERAVGIAPLRSLDPSFPEERTVVLSSAVTDFTGEAVGFVVAALDRSAMAALLGQLAGAEAEYDPVVFDAAREVVLAPPDVTAAVRRALADARPAGEAGALEEVLPRDGEALVAVRTAAHGDPPGWTAVMSVGESYAMGRLRRLRSVLLGLWVGVVAAASAAVVVTLKRAAQPLADVSASMARVAGGDLSTRLPDVYSDDLGRLVRSFNSMVAEVERSRDELQRTEALRRELAIAHRIQTAILPPVSAVKGFEVAARMKPAEEVGGDLYDVLDFGDTFWVIVGDVSGHGVNSGLVMMMAQAAAAATLARDPHCSPAHVIAAVNAVVHENVRCRMNRDDYLTFMAARHVDDGRFVAAGAHQPIFIARRSGQVDVVEPQGAWCGLAPSIDCATAEYEFHVAPGELVCLITDGVVESRGGGAELFGDERLRTVLAGGSRSASKALDDVFEAVERFSSTRADDVTAVILRRDDAH